MFNYRLYILFLLILIAFLVDIAFGSIHIPLLQILDVVSGKQIENDSWSFIIQQIRLPKAFTAIIAGSGLAVSGLQMQTLFRNPLAGPSVLGITAGASLGVAIVMFSAGTITSLYTIKELGISGSWLIILASSAGAALVMFLVLLISGAVKDHIVMLIIGVMLGNITLSLVSIWQYYSAPELIKDYLMWTFGSLGGVNGVQLMILTAVVFFGLILTFIASKSLDALLLGDRYAMSLGLSVKSARILIISSTSLLAGGITAFCGPIGFVGIAVPHLARAIFQTSSHRVLIPACCLIGALLMLICDIFSQLPGSQSVLPINIITALIGSPVVIWVIARRQKRRD
ncbi:iron ABC transporter [Pedobacter antarcticus 4BY]|uniref:Iron ABC transporter n=2 Tax=Pedobacter antarcticus TaxID=34086 RepID=A0A081PBG8_9SPHI|nr:iron ABC transporter permease [Pedobacter antarcticus]KEQ28041.1 iron ABC transporter [Pedobacter antarcticus 4BY]SFE99993.1 iron complex transport system permease protein [Pedobacter antarcticus]